MLAPSSSMSNSTSDTSILTSWRFLWSRVMVLSVEVIQPGSRLHLNIAFFSFVAFERFIRPDDGSSAKICYRYKCERRTNIPSREFEIERDSRVGQHISTNSLVNETSSSWRQLKFNSWKRRPFGRSNNREAMGSIRWTRESFRDPVNLGGFEDWIAASCPFRSSSSTVEKR